MSEAKTREPGGRKHIAVKVSTVLFSIRHNELCVLLSSRTAPPFQGTWKLPGCSLQPPEAFKAAALRSLEERLGISPYTAFFEQLRAYRGIDEESTGSGVTITYWVACSGVAIMESMGRKPFADLIPVAEVIDGSQQAAFHHKRIIEDAYERLQTKLEYTSVASRFCGQQFTISDLRNVYDVVWNTRLDPGNFQRKVRMNSVFSEVGLSDHQTYDQAGRMRRVGDVASGPQGQRSPGFGIRQEKRGSADPEHIRRIKAMKMDLLAGRETNLSAPNNLGQEARRPDSRETEQSKRPRGGRPPSLWIASDTDFLLNAPIVRTGRRW